MAGKKDKLIEEPLETTPEPEVMDEQYDLRVFAGIKELTPMVKARLEYHCTVNNITSPQTMAQWEAILTQL